MFFDNDHSNDLLRYCMGIVTNLVTGTKSLLFWQSRGIESNLLFLLIWPEIYIRMSNKQSVIHQLLSTLSNHHCVTGSSNKMVTTDAINIHLLSVQWIKFLLYNSSIVWSDFYLLYYRSSCFVWTIIDYVKAFTDRSHLTVIHWSLLLTFPILSTNTWVCEYLTCPLAVWVVVAVATWR